MMKLNMSAAVRQQRIEPLDSLDYFPTPGWGTRALIHNIKLNCKADDKIIEPACGEGHMSKVLKETFNNVHSSDVFNYGYGEVNDFLNTPMEYDWMITNPPFKLASEFIHKGLAESSKGVAVLLRIAFLEGKTRYKDLYSKYPPTTVAVFSERLAIKRGIVDERITSQSCYAWFIWDKINYGTSSIEWLPPCKAKLERPEDYDIDKAGNYMR